MVSTTFSEIAVGVFTFAGVIVGWVLRDLTQRRLDKQREASGDA